MMILRCIFFGVLLCCALLHSYDDFTMHLFHCNSKSYRHSFNGNWNIIFIKPTKAFNSICTFSACFKCDSNDNQFLFESHHEKTCLGVSDQV